VVLECGLGGRLDSTNIIKTPILSVITGIALDHTAILGDTPEKIAYEKAGIIKAGVPVLFGGDGDSVTQVIRERAEAVGSRLYLASDDEPTKVRCGLFGADFDVEWISGLHISLLGKYQVKNARNVLFAVRLMREIGLDIPDAAVRRGLEKAVWQARFEVLSREPLVIYDGAHNREGVDALYESVKEYFGDSPLICLSGTLADKEYGHTAEILSRIASRVYTITPENPRALSAEEFAKCIELLGTEAHSSESIPEAVARAYSDAKESGYPLICFGSLYTYADVAEQIRKQKEA
jgi:dihydrofolate synthase/folylpolyglutamate synthase